MDNFPPVKERYPKNTLISHQDSLSPVLSICELFMSQEQPLSIHLFLHP
ncbi:hypothetical protein FHW36_10881 [Chitinophaga polysaccharea]|uniref:Uncharacterized protein n=1 Tax=Chitinophaga polysaccharea TaxID=1293035 RepID=A0A561PC75_9BACT|nr:hypothetical protein FHW36_10881 [Chitinophaga polysaccharea]